MRAPPSDSRRSAGEAGPRRPPTLGPSSPGLWKHSQFAPEMGGVVGAGWGQTLRGLFTCSYNRRQQARGPGPAGARRRGTRSGRVGVKSWGKSSRCRNDTEGRGCGGRGGADAGRVRVGTRPPASSVPTAPAAPRKGHSGDQEHRPRREKLRRKRRKQSPRGSRPCGGPALAEVRRPWQRRTRAGRLNTASRTLPYSVNSNN